MADTNYLYYGDQQVDQQALMNKMANGVVQYVQSQPWTRKRKDMFMSAYSDIMNKGLKGMTNSTGQWMVDFGGPAIDWDSKSRKEKEMYEEAGYFIQQQMNGLVADAKKQDEEKEEIELTPYGSKFKDVFEDYIGRTYFGNRDFNIGGEKDDWNYLDKRNKQGIRGRSERAKKLASYLQSYRDSLKDSNFDFKDSPFSSKEDLITRLDSAIAALKTTDNTQDDTDALNALGLDARDWFNNGSGDTYVDENGNTAVGSDGKLLSYAQYYNNLALQEKTKQEKEQKAAEEKQKALDALQIYTSKPHQKLYSFTDLNNRYGDTNSFLDNFKDKQIQDLSQKESDELTSFFYNLNSTDKGKQNLQDLTDEEWEPLKSKLQPLQSQYGYGTIERNKNQFKKVKGLDGIYYDTVQNALVQVGQQGQEPLEDLFSGQNDKKQAEINMNTALKDIPGLSKEMRNELWATGLDLVSIANPEALSGSAMALYAAYLRDEANPNRGSFEKWLDYGTGALGGIQVIGDAMLTGKVGYNLYKLGKLINSSTKAAGAIGSVFALSGVPEAGESLKKLATEGVGSMTPKDVQNLAYGFMALMGVKAFATARNKQVIARQANPTVTEHNVTIKDSKGQSHEVKVDAETASQVQQIRTFAKKKADVDSEILNIPKMRESIQKYNESNPTKKLELEGASVQNNSKSVSGRSGRNKIVQSKQVKDPNAPQYSPVGTNYWLNPGYLRSWQREVWSQPELQSSGKGFMERVRDFWNPEPIPVSSNRTPTNNPPAGEKVSTNDFIPQGVSTNTMQKVNKALGRNNNYKLTGSTRLPNPKLNGSKQPLIDGSTYKLSFDGDKTFTISYNGTNIPITGKTLQEAKINLGKKVDEINSKLKLPKNFTKDSKEWQNMLKSIRELKREGYFMKQGGKITDTQIDNFLKQYKI